MPDLPESAAPLPSPVSPLDPGGPTERPVSSLVRLLMVPLVLVAAAVLVWLWVRWPGRQQVSPRELVRDLGRPSKSHWQQAYALAELLRDPRHADLKRDGALAAELAALLETQLDAGQRDSNRISMRVFLCRALGEFTAPSIQPVLIRASQLERGPEELAVRCSAVEALAAHAAQGGPDAPETNAAVLAAVMAAARDNGPGPAGRTQRAELRARAAFALGVLGGAPALAELQRMLDDPVPNVRYNAATGLARHGRTAATPVLLEMLDAQNPEAVVGEALATGRAWKRAAVAANAIRAAKQLIQQNPQADRLPLLTAIAALVNADVTPSVRSLAREAMLALSDRPPP